LLACAATTDLPPPKPLWSLTERSDCSD
jgi:hypothetical protein